MSNRLVAETGRPTGTPASRRLRQEGKVPGVLYGRGADPVSIAVDGRELRAALSTEQRLNAVLTLVVDGEEHLAMAKDIQRHTTRHTVLHVDFFAVSRDEEVTVDAPVQVVGEANLPSDATIGVVLTHLTLRAKPGAIPNSIDVDASTFEVGTTITVRDLRLPPGTSTDMDPDQAVVTVALAGPTEVAGPDGDEAVAEAGEDADEGGAAGE